MCTYEGLLEKLEELTKTSRIDLNICSTRVCKSCYRRIDSLHTKSKVLRLDLQEFRRRFQSAIVLDDVKNCNEGQDSSKASSKSYFKRVAKESPSRQQKRPCNVQLSFGNIDVAVLDWSVVNEKENKPQTDFVQSHTLTSQCPSQNKLSVEVCIVQLIL